MTQSKRLLFYLALNVLVSACVTLSILWLWNRSHPAMPVSFPPAASPSGSSGQPASLTPVQPTAAPASSPVPDASGSIIQIENVFGAGDLANEVVLVRRTGSGELPLTGWQITGEEGPVFTFPSLVLYTGGAVQVHSAAGVNTVVDLYWGLDAPIWQPGETVTLVDPAGKVHATYRLP